jgi:hypothetical protein
MLLLPLRIGQYPTSQTTLLYRIGRKSIDSMHVYRQCAFKLLVSMHITDGNKHPARYNHRGKDTDKWENHVIFFPSASSEKEIQFFVRLKPLKN